MEIIPNVHLVPGIRGTNVYLLLGQSLTLVDSGMPGSAKTILAYIRELGHEPTDLARIVVTHHHLDHVGGMAALKEQTGAQVLAHPADAAFIAGEQAPPPAQSGLMRIVFRLLSPLMPGARPAAVDTTVEDGDHLDLLGGATVVHVPGHTPGSIALHFPAERLLICGDVIDHRREQLGPPPAGFTVDMAQAHDSLRRLAGLEFDVLCPGHGTPLVGGAGEQLRALVQSLD
jgi:glyoxylase-like metal-dependent hydrolase (beta-lactamase superfamily II)